MYLRTEYVLLRKCDILPVYLPDDKTLISLLQFVYTVLHRSSLILRLTFNKLTSC